jgi:hypothetical protein
MVGEDDAEQIVFEAEPRALAAKLAKVLGEGEAVVPSASPKAQSAAEEWVKVGGVPQMHTNGASKSLYHVCICHAAFRLRKLMSVSIFGRAL